MPTDGVARQGAITTSTIPSTPTRPVSQTQENIRKCKNFLTTLIKLASSQPQDTVDNVRMLVQSLIVSTGRCRVRGLEALVYRPRVRGLEAEVYRCWVRGLEAVVYRRWVRGLEAVVYRYWVRGSGLQALG